MRNLLWFPVPCIYYLCLKIIQYVLMLPVLIQYLFLNNVSKCAAPQHT